MQYFFHASATRTLDQHGVALAELPGHLPEQGGAVVEAYPVEPRKDKVPDVFAWTGLASAYTKVGFKECERRSETRPIMRFYIED